MAEPAPPGQTFEQALTQLEQVVRQLEDGQIGLEDSLQRYEQGVQLIRHCFTLLRKVEQRVSVIQSVDDAGQPVTAPFAAAPESAEAPAAAPKRRRAGSSGGDA